MTKTKVTLSIVEDRRSLGPRVLTRIRGRIAGEPPGVTLEASQWWFMVGWVLRGCAIGTDDEELVEEIFVALTIATGESRVE